MVHAEVNAIASSRQDLRGSTMYVSLSPCKDCCKAIITAGIKRLVYKHKYENDDFEFVSSMLKKCSVELVKIV
jgi:dCMP deaminase